MSVRELKRAEVLAQVKAGARSLRSASQVMGLSYRQTKRVWKRFCRAGARGLRHRSAGRRSNRRTPAAVRRKIVGVVRREFGGDAEHERFGPTLAAEHLHEEYGLTVHPETLRRWMLAAGLWSRARAAQRHRRRRERKAHFGELVQLDGSFEAWLEDRAPVGCLMHLVDDATSRGEGRFEAQETIWGAVRALRGWIVRYGVPHALYTDWKNVYVRKPTDAEVLAGDAGLTHFGRMCATLGIRIIAASSPQAKGRVERGHGTHQDRLIKKLRRLGVTTYERATAYLQTTYWVAHNARFARPPASPEDFHTPLPAEVDLDEVFRIEVERSVSHDWVVRHENQCLQIERRQRRLPPARSKVLVCEYEDGHLEIWYRGHRVQYTVLEAAARAVPAPAPQPTAPSPVRPRPRPPGDDHPWRRGFDTRAARRAAPEQSGHRRAQPPVEAAGVGDAADASPAPWKTADRLPQLPPAASSSGGHF